MGCIQLNLLAVKIERGHMCPISLFIWDVRVPAVNEKSIKLQSTNLPATTNPNQ